MELEREKRLDIHFEIAPLIDVVFLLLIFFMLTSSFIMEPGIKISLPEASTAQPYEEDIRVFVTRDNKIYLGDKRIELEDLKGRLIERLGEDRKRTVILKADEGIRYGLAVKVIDIIREAGAENLVISTEERDEGRQDL